MKKGGWYRQRFSDQPKRKFWLPESRIGYELQSRLTLTFYLRKSNLIDL